MFTSECLQGISYESTTAAVFLAGVFLSFLVDYLGSRFILWRRGQHSHSHSHSHDAAGENTLAGDSKDVDRTPNSSAVSMQHDDDHSSHVNIHNAAEETVAVWVLEAGVIFHSLCKS
jgi:zinc transporter 1/2/3